MGEIKNILIPACICNKLIVILVNYGQDQDWNEMGGREIFHYVLFYSINFCTSAEKIFFNSASSFLLPFSNICLRW